MPGFKNILGGLFPFIVQKRKNLKGQPTSQLDPYVRAVLQAMLSTSVADGELDKNEIAAIAEIYLQIFGGELETRWIQETADSMLSDDFDIGETLSARAELIEDSMKPVILRAAWYVAAADGNVDDNEKSMLLTIAGALKMDKSTIENTFEELQKLAT
jgi:tellurite resistance protein